MSYSGISNSVIDIIGNTPMVMLNKLTDPKGAKIAVKLEAYNPSESLKDRIAVGMIRDAEEKGILKPGGAVVEGSSGNTAAGIAMAAAVMGYRAILVVTDKQSREKIGYIKAFGGEVVVTSYTAHADSPEYYLNKAKSIAEEIPGSFFTNQFANQINPEVHYKTTGKEIWEQTDGKVDSFVMGMGTGGCISGVGKYLKERNKNVQIIGAEPKGSVIKNFFDTGELGEFTPYLVEGIGEDIIPDCLHLDYVDKMYYITDKEAMETSRRLAREEGILCGMSSGVHIATALRQAKTMSPDQLVVTICGDSGAKYLSKQHSDEWMKEQGFLNPESSTLKMINELKNSGIPKVVNVSPVHTVQEAIDIMTKYHISQIPVVKKNKSVGSLREGNLMTAIFKKKIALDDKVKDAMDASFPQLDENVSVKNAISTLKNNSAALVISENNIVGIITRYDILEFTTNSK